MKSRRLALLVIGVTLLLPIVLALTVWPSPMGDLRQQLVWGRGFPLVTPRHPPMMVWLSTIVAHVFGPAVIPQLVAGQILIVVGAIYVYRILRLTTEEDNAFLFAFLFVTAFFVFLGPSSWVMNADMLQVTSWPAIVYHFLQAVRSNRWRHWLALGAWSAAGVLSKYSVAVLFAAMLIAIIAVPAMRAAFRRPGFYVAVLFGALLVAPHLVALVASPGSVAFATTRFGAGHSLASVLQSYWQLVWGYLQIGFPVWLLVAIGWASGLLVFRKPRDVAAPWPDALRFVLVLNFALLALVVLLIGAARLEFRYHFNLPFVTIAWLTLGLFAWAPGRQAAAEPMLMKGIGVLNVSVVAVICALYTFFTAHSGLQEPVREPGNIVLADWRANYACGPAYIFGEDKPTLLIAGYADVDITPITYFDFPRSNWFDADRLRRLGGIVVQYGPITDKPIHDLLPGVPLTKQRAFSLPLRWTLTGQTITYHYEFIPPQGCGG